MKNRNDLVNRVAAQAVEARTEPHPGTANSAEKVNAAAARLRAAIRSGDEQDTFDACHDVVNALYWVALDFYPYEVTDRLADARARMKRYQDGSITGLSYAASRALTANIRLASTYGEGPEAIIGVLRDLHTCARVLYARDTGIEKALEGALRGAVHSDRTARIVEAVGGPDLSFAEGAARQAALKLVDAAKQLRANVDDPEFAVMNFYAVLGAAEDFAMHGLRSPAIARTIANAAKLLDNENDGMLSAGEFGGAPRV